MSDWPNLGQKGHSTVLLYVYTGIRRHDRIVEATEWSTRHRVKGHFDPNQIFVETEIDF